MSSDLNAEVERLQKEMEQLSATLDSLVSEFAAAASKAALPLVDRIVHTSIEYSSASIEKLGPEGVKVLKREIEAVKADLNELKGLKIGDRSKWPHVVGMVQVDAELRPISDSFLEEDFRVLLSRVVPVLGKHRVQVPRETTALLPRSGHGSSAPLPENLAKIADAYHKKLGEYRDAQWKLESARKRASEERARKLWEQA